MNSRFADPCDSNRTDKRLTGCTWGISAQGLTDIMATSGHNTIPQIAQPGSGELLHSASTRFSVVPAIPVKRRGKSMSRRTGQNGFIERSGKWYVVRWWMDVAGQQERKHMRARVCPISGPGLLSKSERERRGREIVAKSGADTVEYFNEVVQQQKGGV